MTNSIAVGLAEIKISRDPNDVLVAFGLGSCLGIGMYDPKLRVSGLLHAVLPHCNNKDGISPKYVDTGIKLLLDQLLYKGANRTRLIIRMVGGANMLNIGNAASPFDIGTRNIEAAHEIFSKLRLYVKNEEVGGQTGRTVRFYVADGRMTIRMMGGKEREI